MTPERRPRRPGIALAAAALLASASAASAAPATLRVGTSGDYPPFSAVAADGAGVQGFDVALAQAYAEERGLALELVRFTWPQLEADLAAGRFDVAASGITVHPRRSLAGRFGVPLVESGAVVLAREPTLASSLDDLDRRGVRIAVNAGGYLERAARQRFPHATLVAVPDNAGVREALAALSTDAVVTDVFEAPVWEREVEDTRRFGPFTRDRKAWLVRPDRPELAADLDAWLLAAEVDGRLASLRRRHLGGVETPPTAMPLAALVAALDERLALMPWVAVVKRRDSRPIADPAQEARVIDAALAAVVQAAARSQRPAPPADLVRAFFREQIEASKDVQLAAARDPDFAPEEPLPDLDTELRPALLRIGQRVAELLVALPEGLGREEIEAACRDGLRSPWLPDLSGRVLTRALWRLASAPRAAPAAPTPGVLPQRGAREQSGRDRQREAHGVAQ
jgi:cyclohexadienyl dehydratase